MSECDESSILQLFSLGTVLDPNRLEQRVGRIDRFGQPEKAVSVCLLVMDDPLHVQDYIQAVISTSAAN